MNTPLLIEDPDCGDTYYTGPLMVAQDAARKDRHVHKGQRPDGVWFVHLCDDFAGEQVAEWGNGSTIEQAWRFALGAYFGPIDEEYDEAALAHFLFGGQS